MKAHMDKLLALILCTMLSFQPLAKESDTSQCDEIYGVAKGIMTARIEGVDIITLIKVFKANGAGNYEMLIIDAYSKQIYLSELNEVKSAELYASKLYKECIQQVMEE